MSVYSRPLEYRKEKLTFLIPRNRKQKTSKVFPVSDIPNQVVNPLVDDFYNDNIHSENIRIQFKEKPLSRNTKTRTWIDMFKSRQKITPSNFRAGKNKEKIKQKGKTYNSRKNRTKRTTKRRKYNNIKNVKII
jgi:hypothetical protein